MIRRAAVAATHIEGKSLQQALLHPCADTGRFGKGILKVTWGNGTAGGERKSRRLEQLVQGGHRKNRAQQIRRTGNKKLAFVDARCREKIQFLSRVPNDAALELFGGHVGANR